MMSQALFATGQFDEAAGALQMGLSQLPEPQWGVVVENYRQLYGPNDAYSDQLKALEKSNNDNPSDPAQQLLLGYQYGFLGYPVQAVEKLNRAMQLAPQDLLAQKLREIMAAKAAAKGEAVQPAPALPKQKAPFPAPGPAIQGPNTPSGPGFPSAGAAPQT
jgi:tetratricopeptide (TPR) repeat protein